MTTIYKSNFLKADTRKEQPFIGGKSYKSGNGDMITIEDVFLSPAAELTIKLASDELNILFPIVGKVVLANDSKEISPEELLCYCGNEAKDLTVSNPFTDETINFLHIRINKAGHTAETTGLSFSTLKIDRKNELIQAGGVAHCLKAGVYDSRVKDKTSLTEGFGGLFTYIINGSFDFEERLMEYRDSLYQWDINEVDFEALSETAIILLIECSLLK